MPGKGKPSGQSLFDLRRRVETGSDGSLSGVRRLCGRPTASTIPFATETEGQVIQKAKTAYFNSTHRIEDHFGAVTEMIQIGSGAMRPVRTVYLSPEGDYTRQAITRDALTYVIPGPNILVGGAKSAAHESQGSHRWLP